MPHIAAALAPILATELFAGITVGAVVTSVALSGVSYIVTSALAPKLGGGADRQSEQKIVSRAATPIQRFIYGRALVGGDLFFLEVKPPYLYYGLILASHEIDGIDEVRIGDDVVNLDSNGNATNAPYKTGTQIYVQFSFRTGTDSQAIDPILAADFPELPATFRQRGHATAVVKMYYGVNNSDAGAEDHQRVWGGQAPQTRFLVRGFKVYDPNEPTQDPEDTSTHAFSDTASLCLAHYLTHPKGGKVPWTKMDIDALKTAAQGDSQQVENADGSNEKRYSVNGVVLLDSEPIDIIQNLLTANVGRLVWRDGKYAILSGIPRDPTWSLNDDSARGGMEVRFDRPKRELVNTVRTRFTAPDREYQLSNGPIFQNATYLADDGEEFSIGADLPYTSSHTRAQRIAKIIMEKSRLGRYVTRRESIDGIRLSAADVINLESAFIPNVDAQYEVNVVRISDTFEFEVELEEYDSEAIYTWDPATDEQPFELEPAELAGVN